MRRRRCPCFPLRHGAAARHGASAEVLAGSRASRVNGFSSGSNEGPSLELDGIWLLECLVPARTLAAGSAIAAALTRLAFTRFALTRFAIAGFEAAIAPEFAGAIVFVVEVVLVALVAAPEALVAAALLVLAAAIIGDDAKIVVGELQVILCLHAVAVAVGVLGRFLYLSRSWGALPRARLSIRLPWLPPPPWLRLPRPRRRLF